MAALALALGGSVVVGSMRDWSSGRLVEPWQVERALNLTVLSRVRRS
jgi:hypothetical protein